MLGGGGFQRSIQALNYLLPNLANMQVICGVATSQLSHLLSAAPNPPLATTFPSNMPSPPALAPSRRDFYCFISMLHMLRRTPTLREPSDPNNFWQISA